MTSRVLIICFAFRIPEIIRASLDSLLRTSDGAHVCIIENRSERTASELAPLFFSHLKKRNLIGYFQFDANITNNAAEVANDSGFLHFDAYDYVVFTDCDLIAPEHWLPAHIQLLKDCPEVFSVSAPISYENLPPGTRAAIGDKYFQPTDVREKYDVFRSGMHLTTFRAEEYKAFVDWRLKVGVHFADRLIEYFGSNVLHKVSARSRIAQAYHLSWDLSVANEGSAQVARISTEHREAYMAEKSARGAALWRHDNYCDYSYFAPDKTYSVFVPSDQPLHTAIEWWTIVICNDTSNPVTVTLNHVHRNGSIECSRASTVASNEVVSRRFLQIGLSSGSLQLIASVGLELHGPLNVLITFNLQQLQELNWTISLSPWLNKSTSLRSLQA